MPDTPKPNQVASPARLVYVLDSYALFAYFDEEADAEIVSNLLARATQSAELYVSIINLGEFVYASEREKGWEQADSRLRDFRRLPIGLEGVNEQRVLAAAHIKTNYRVSYADAFAIALAQELNATVVTGDPEFESVEKIVDVLWLGRRKKPVNQVKERRAAYRIKKRSVKRSGS